MFESMYEPYPTELEAFGDHWCGPDKYPHWGDTLVATYEGTGDGQTVEVYCTAGPARFYTLRIRAGKDSVGAPQKPWQLGTGSGEEKLAADIAKAISEGGLGLDQTLTESKEKIPLDAAIAQAKETKP